MFFNEIISLPTQCKFTISGLISLITFNISLGKIETDKVSFEGLPKILLTFLIIGGFIVLKISPKVVLGDIIFFKSFLNGKYI